MGKAFLWLTLHMWAWEREGEREREREREKKWGVVASTKLLLPHVYIFSLEFYLKELGTWDFAYITWSWDLLTRNEKDFFNQIFICYLYFWGSESSDQFLTSTRGTYHSLSLSLQTFKCESREVWTVQSSRWLNSLAAPRIGSYNRNSLGRLFMFPFPPT